MRPVSIATLSAKTDMRDSVPAAISPPLIVGLCPEHDRSRGILAD